MAYTYNPINNELLEMIDLYDDPFIENKKPEPKKKKGLNPQEYKQMMNYLTSPRKKIKDFPVRKPEAVPPKTETIQKFAEGGLSRKTLLDMLKNEYPKEFDRYKNLSTEKLKQLLNNLDTAGVPFRKGGKVNKEEAEKRAQEIKEKIYLMASESPLEEAEMSILSDIKYMEQLRKYLKDNPTKTEDDFKKEILKIPLAEGGPVEENLTKRTIIDDIILSSAMNKISDAMSGISGLMARSRLNSGGKAKIKQPKQIKRINLADYFKAGIRVADLSPQERTQVNSLLSKMLRGAKDN
jgi:hypothetical protein